MSNPLPFIAGTSGTLNAQLKYPFVRAVSFQTHVDTFMNGNEQRWPMRGPLYSFTLPMSSLSITDKQQYLSFQQSVKGRFSQNLSITLGSTAYNNITLLSDDLSQTNTVATLFSQQIALRQVQNFPVTLPSALTVFPLLSFGASCELPFTQVSSYLTAVNDNPSGPRFAWEWFGSSLTGFPGTGSGATATASLSGGAVSGVAVGSGGSHYVMAVIVITGDGKGAAAIPIFTNGVLTGATVIRGGHGYTTATATVIPLPYLRSWSLTYPLLSDADASTLEQAFMGWQGRTGSFTFVDPLDGIAYTNVRCDQDELQLRGITVNQQSTSLTLRQTNGS